MSTTQKYDNDATYRASVDMRAAASDVPVGVILVEDAHAAKSPLGAIVVIGNGASSIPEIRAAESLPENWRLAMDRGDCEVGHEPDGEEWCVVLPGDFDTALLETDNAVAGYGRVPADSPALARWRAA